MVKAPPPLQRAFKSLLKSKARATGKKEFIILNGHAKEAIVYEITSDEIFVSGGRAEAGGFSASVAQSILPVAPERFTEIEVRGNRLQVLSVNDRNGITWEITAGDPASEDK